MPQQDQKAYEGVDLTEYILVSWKHRWWILIATAALAVAAGVLSYFLPKVWEVEAIVVPSKFLVQTQTGEFKEILVVNPGQVANQISEGSYDALIAAEMNIDFKKSPRLKSDNIRNTNLVRVSVRVREPQKGREILLALFNHLKSDFDKKIDVEFSNINNQIDQRESSILEGNLKIDSQKIEKDRIRQDIVADRNKMAISEQRIADVQEEMKSVRTRIAELDELQRKTLAEHKDETETLALLLYSNEVQQNIRYMNSLEDKVSSERVNVENLSYLIKSKEQLMRQIDNQVDQIQIDLNDAKNDIRLLEDKKNRIDYSQLVKEPISSSGPVSPRKTMIVLVAGFIGFCLSSAIFFFRDQARSRAKKNP
ncbi:MAG: LPS O-antigen length regulator [Candidatus Omnitrophica bacterium ADurb.Bin277]|nr:MAG: LPS O-antigen length regulator [Candidatus Omnitrophica bacterium ADurb.Bin277]